MDPLDAFARTVGIQIEEMQAMLSRRALLTTGLAATFIVGKPSFAARVAMPARRIFLANPHTGDVFHDVYFADGAYVAEVSIDTCVIAARHRLLETAELRLDRDEVARAREGVLAQREALAAGRPLVVQRDARVLREGELAARQRRLPDDRAQERRLAGPVRPGERESVAAAQPERDPVEEGVARELLAEARCGEHGHRGKGRRRGAASRVRTTALG